jgi:uncharacterized protein (TIGR02646 family)
MIRIVPEDLAEATQEYLEDKQQQIDLEQTYADQVAKGKSLWATKSANHFGKGNNIRETLRKSCTGLGRCHYCEDSIADEIEHIFPKDLFPDKVFRWENYLYACGQCNGAHKKNQFAIIDEQGEILDITRPNGAEIVAPALGQPLLIDIRNEDPFLFFDIDFITGVLTFKPERGSIQYKRAEYTCKTIDLNRDVLKRARKNTYKEFLSLIGNYTRSQQRGENTTEFKGLKIIILEHPHRTVWELMKRCSDINPDLNAKFRIAPELMTIG